MPKYSLNFFCVSGAVLCELTVRLSQTVSVTGQNEISLDMLVGNKLVLKVVKNYLVAPSFLGSLICVDGNSCISYPIAMNLVRFL